MQVLQHRKSDFRLCLLIAVHRSIPRLSDVMKCVHDMAIIDEIANLIISKNIGKRQILQFRSMSSHIDKLSKKLCALSSRNQAQIRFGFRDYPKNCVNLQAGVE